MMVDESTKRGSLAEKLDTLFKTVGKEGGKEPTYQDLADRIAERSGVKISPSYIWELRTGVTTNPRRGHLEALAAYFGVPVSYFFDESDPERVDPVMLAAMRNPEMRRVVVRASDLSPAGVAALARIVESLRMMEKLPADGDGSA